MKTKLSAILFLLLPLLPCTILAEEKYDDVRKLLDEWASAAEEFIASAEKAASVEEAINSLRRFDEKMNDLRDRIEGLVKRKYPELKSWRDKDKRPPELQPQFTRVEDLLRRLEVVMEKNELFNDPRVFEEMNRLQRERSTRGQQNQ